MKCQNIIINTINPLRKIKYPPTKSPIFDLSKTFSYAPLNEQEISKIAVENKALELYPKFRQLLFPERYSDAFYSEKESSEILKMYKEKPDLIYTLVETTTNSDSKICFFMNNIKNFFEKHSEQVSKIKLLLNNKKELNDIHLSENPCPSGISMTLEKLGHLPDEDFINLLTSKINYFDKFNLYALAKTHPEEISKINNSGLYSLIEENKIEENVIQNIGYNKFFSQGILDDFKKLQNKESIVKTLPLETNIKQLPTLIKSGEIAEINNKLYIHNGKATTELKITRETLENLFPILDRNLIKQGKNGNCWVLAAIDAIMDIPAGKACIYSFFEEDGKDILVKFPNKKQKIRFKDGKAIKTPKGLDGALGYKLLEQAYAIHFKNHYPKNAKEVVINDLGDKLEEYLGELKGGFSIDAVKDFTGYKFSLKEKFYNAIGITPSMDKIIKEGANDKNAITFMSFYAENQNLKNFLLQKYNIITRHAYAIKGYNQKLDTVLLSNPHDTQSLIEIPASVAKSFCGQIGMVKI